MRFCNIPQQQKNVYNCLEESIVRLMGILYVVD